MNQDEILARWLAEKRKLAPPSTFSHSVMASIEQSSQSRWPVTKAFPQPSLTASQNVPHWVTSAAVLVCIIRTACFVQMLIEPTREYSLVAEKAISEMPNVK